MKAVVAPKRIARAILVLRDHKVPLDETLAELYGVPTKILLQAVKRNLERFPNDFLFQLTADEWTVLRSQSVTSKRGSGGRRYAPYAFTEQGVAMLSSVLRSPSAVQVNIQIMRTFVQLRGLLGADRELARQLDALEHRVSSHDQAIAGILSAIRQLTAQPEPKRRSIGFVSSPEKERD